MLEKISLRLRLTVLSVLLLTICCVCLTLILNLSANQMVNTIEATPIIPAYELDKDGLPVRLNSASAETKPAHIVNSQPARKTFFSQSLIYMVIVVFVGGSLTYYLSGKALVPLQELSGRMKNRTVHNLSEELPVPKSKDEIADLTLSFNEMSVKLDDAFAMQKRFAQSAAHELRTPLTVLKTKLDVFKKKKTHTPEEYDKLLCGIIASTDRLSELVKELLDLSNIDAAEYTQDIEAKSLLCEAADELSTLADAKNVRITVSGDEQIVTGNRSLLYRAFYNLLENAIKYNCENGIVEAVISRLAEHTLITIKDCGIGIPKEMQKLIFEPFFRVDKSRSRQMGGAGLGLATVKAIIDKHSGTISVSENACGGTVFEIEL